MSSCTAPNSPKFETVHFAYFYYATRDKSRPVSGRDRASLSRPDIRHYLQGEDVEIGMTALKARLREWEISHGI